MSSSNILIIFSIFVALSCLDKSGEVHQANAQQKSTVSITNSDEALEYYLNKYPPRFKKGSKNSPKRIMMEKNVTNDDLKYLVFFPELKELYVLDSKKVTDEGLKYIENLLNIEYLILWGTNISIKGLQKLSKLKKIKSLGIDDTNIADDDLRIIADLFPKLESLGLAENSIKGPGIQYLKNLPLGELDLNKTQISDDTVKYFAGFKNCEIYLHNTKVTEKGKKEILRITKDCTVSIKEGDLEIRE